MPKICSYCNQSFTPKSKERECSIQCKLLANVKIKDNCWEWQKGKTKFGYGKITYRNKFTLAHRISFLTFKGEISQDYSVLHSCDNPSCINPDHLWLGTQHDNVHDCIVKCRRNTATGWKHTDQTKIKLKNRRRPDKRGEKHHLAKLNCDNVKEIIHLNNGGMKQAEIAEKFNLSQSTISKIVNKKRWPHLIIEV